MKKIIAVLLVACVVASGVFAAGGKDSGKDQAVTTATLTVGIWDKNQEPG